MNNNFLSKNYFLHGCCALILMLSIYLRSILDIGPDSAIYIGLAKKIVEGKKYYYDFFETNFPLVFYIYAFQYKVASFLNISPIIFSEIFINLSAIFAIRHSAKLIKKTTFFDNKIEYNLLVISFYLAFFIRPLSIKFHDYGTKTSFLIISIILYLAYSFEGKFKITKKYLLIRGLVIAFICCLKPHYAIIIIFLESYLLFTKKTFIDQSCKYKTFLNRLSYFIELDKIIAVIAILLYVFWIIFFIPEFFYKMIPVLNIIYYGYSNYKVFINNIFFNLSQIVYFLGLALVFPYSKSSKNDSILLIVFFATIALILLESIGTYDQFAVFFSVLVIFGLRATAIIITKKALSYEGKFLLGIFLTIPFFYYLGGIFLISWYYTILPIISIFHAVFIVIYHYKKLPNQKFKAFYNFKNLTIIFCIIFVSVILTIFSYKYQKISFLYINLGILMSSYAYFLEIKIMAKINNKLSLFASVIFAVSMSALMYIYVHEFDVILSKNLELKTERRFLDSKAHYYKIFANNKNDSDIYFGEKNDEREPLVTYLKKDIKQKFFLYSYNQRKYNDNLDSNVKNIIKITNDDIKKSLLDKNTKIIFAENTDKLTQKNILFILPSMCKINILESYFYDEEIKKIFTRNYRFENNIIATIDDKFDNIGSLSFFKKSDKQKIYRNFDVYVRK